MENVIVTVISRETNALNVMLNITIGLFVKVSGNFEIMSFYIDKNHFQFIKLRSTDEPNSFHNNDKDSYDLFSLGCNCNKHGRKNEFCSNDGKCNCKYTFAGDKCDQCDANHYGFPKCIGGYITIF